MWFSKAVVRLIQDGSNMASKCPHRSFSTNYSIPVLG